MDRPDDDDANSERPTLVPKYDVDALARKAGVPSSRGPAGSQRPEMPTLTDPVELEAARVASTFTSPPPALEATEGDMSEDALIGDYEARFGSFKRIPVISMSSADLTKLVLDTRAGFVLALVDGALDIQTILDVSGMPLPDTLAVLEDLQDKRIITFR